MNAHTPGTWHQGRDKNGKPIICQEYDVDLYGTEPNPEWQANCRLVSAAPELLEALKRMEFAFSPLAKDCTLAGLIDEARAVIAKATGVSA